ncbi:NAD(P)H-dependent oxidoreductase subunit E, partial [Streptomyces kanamyceticus]
MDLRFGDSKPTDEERAAVDAVLGPPESAWEGADDRSDADLRWARGGRVARERRDLLLPGLHALNDRVGWISEGGLDYLCRRLTVPPAEGYGVATFYSMFSVRARARTVVRVCTDLACGGADLCGEVEERLGSVPKVTVEASPCLGLCERAPAALVVRAGPPAVSFPDPAPSRNRGSAPDPGTGLAPSPAPPSSSSNAGRAGYNAGPAGYSAPAGPNSARPAIEDERGARSAPPAFEERGPGRSP